MLHDETHETQQRISRSRDLCECTTKFLLELCWNTSKEAKQTDIIGTQKVGEYSFAERRQSLVALYGFGTFCKE